MKKLWKRSWSILISALMVLVMMQAAMPSMTVMAAPAGYHIQGTAYYLDAETGNDNYNGTTPETAWKSLEKVNATTFQPGDAILLKAGCTWYGKMWPKGSGTQEKPIIIGKYGDGDIRPKIDGEGDVVSCVRLRNQEYWEIYDLELTNWVKDEDRVVWKSFGTPAIDPNYPYLEDTGATDYVAGIYISGYEEVGGNAKTLNHFVIKNCYMHDINGLREWDPTVEVAGTVLKGSYSRPQFLGDEEEGFGFNPAWFKGSGGILIASEDARVDTGEGEDYTPPVGPEPPITNFNDILIEGNNMDKVSEVGVRIGQAVTLRAYLNNNGGNWDPKCGYATNVRIQGNLITGGLTWSDFGILVSPSWGLVVESNIVSDFGVSGIEDTNSTNGIFQYNEVYNIRKRPAGLAADNCAFDADGRTANNITQYNYAHDCVDGLLSCEYAGSGYAPNIYRYNILEDISGRMIYGPNAAEFYNNTFYAKDTLNPSISGNGSFSIYNNIFYLPAGARLGACNYDNNLYFGGVASPASDKNAILGDPKLVNPGKGPTASVMGQPNTGGLAENLSCYKLDKSSPAIDNGRLIENNGGKDFFGTELADGAVDIGAHEYVGEKEIERINGISLNQTDWETERYGVTQLEVSFHPDSAVNRKVSYASTDPGIAAVTDSGLVTAVNEGRADIVVTSQLDPSKTAVCHVNVTGRNKEYVSVMEDAFVRAAAADSNFNGSRSVLSGEDRHIWIRGLGNNAYSEFGLFKFDLSSVSTDSVQHAAVRFNTSSCYGSGVRLFVTKDGGWDADTVTWNSAKQMIHNCTEAGIIEELPNVSANENYAFEFDITEIVNESLGGDFPGELTFVLKRTSGNSMYVTAEEEGRGSGREAVMILTSMAAGANKSALEAEIENAEAVDTSLFTEESAAYLREKLDAAKELMQKEAATQQEVDAAVLTLTEAVGKLEEKPDVSDGDGGDSGGNGDGGSGDSGSEEGGNGGDGNDKEDGEAEKPDSTEEERFTYVPTTPEEIRRYACKASELILKQVQNAGRSQVEIYGEVQGPKFFKAVAVACGGRYEIGKTLNVRVDGALSYGAELREILITIAIPEELRAAGREFAVVTVDEEGIPVIQEDKDKDADTVTFAVGKGYAYGICYR